MPYNTSYNYHYDDVDDDDYDEDDVVTWEHLEDVSAASTSNESSNDKGTSDFENENVPRSSHIEDIADAGADADDARRHQSGRFRAKRWWFGRAQSERDGDSGKKRG